MEVLLSAVQKQKGMTDHVDCLELKLSQQPEEQDTEVASRSDR